MLKKEKVSLDAKKIERDLNRTSIFVILFEFLINLILLP